MLHVAAKGHERLFYAKRRRVSFFVGAWKVQSVCHVLSGKTFPGDYVNIPGFA
jgi:hypothetical protein